MNNAYLSTISSSTMGWTYLTNWVLALILGVAFIFYFARLVGALISFLFRLFIWKRCRLRVSIGAFRVSPLGGRISARNVVFSNADYTVSILRVNFTWRYWLVQLTRLPAYYIGANAGSGISSDQNAKLPTRFQVLIDGLEIFYYNRTVAYENILETLKKASGSDSSASFKSASTDSSLAASDSVSTALNGLLSFLPVQATIKRGAFVLGNHSVPSILVASFKTASAVVDVSQAACAQDLFRLVVDLDMEKFQVSLKPNITFDPQKYAVDDEFAYPRDTKLSRSKTSKFRRKMGQKLQRSRELTRQGISKLLQFLDPRNIHRKEPSVPENYQWHGLRRYVGNFERDRVVELTDIDEYAKYSLVLESEATRLIYYFDSPGLHTAKSDFQATPEDNPELGVDLILSMATIHYGSWADRQRGPLQAILFPGLARDSSPTPDTRRPGYLRSYAGFNFRIKTNDEIIFWVPTREFSKDKEELELGKENPEVSVSRDKKATRPFGWMEMKMGRGSEVHSFNSYIATADGWPNTVVVRMKKLETRTSVTHNILYTADEHTVHGSIGFPLKWNGSCRWDFDMVSEKGRFFFLREHVDLFTDLVADFGSGPPASYENYRPFLYNLGWKIHDFKFFLNVNDHNIINDPLDFDSNKYLCFSGHSVEISSVIPLKGAFSSTSTIEYRIFTPKLDLTLEVPPWHTVSAFMKGSKKMGTTDSFEVSGYYNFYSQIQVDHHNFAVINAIGDNITLLFYGYFIRYLFTLRENYFGDFTTFMTFEEYTQRQASENKLETSSKQDADYWNILKTENDLNVLFTFSARNGMVVLPCQIFDYSRHISLTFDYLDVDIHLTNFYMDMQVDFSTGYGYQVQGSVQPELVFSLDQYQNQVVSSPEIVIDGFSVHAHRMLGIDNLTYQCKWDFACDSIVMDSDASLLNGLSLALSNFAIGFKDLENILSYEVPTIYDAAHFSFRCPEIRVRLSTGIPDMFMETYLGDVLVTFNDVANPRYSSRISVLFPQITVKIEDGSKIHAFLETSLTITDICQKQNMLEHRSMQQVHVRRNDAPTHRVPFYLFPETRDEVYDEALGSVFASVSLPKASYPLTEEYYEIHAGEEDISSSSSFSGSSTSSFSSKSGRTSLEASEMNPTIDYYDPDFAPRKDPDPGWLYDCFVFEFDTVKAFLTPKAVECVSNVILDAHNLDFVCLVDRLHRETIKKLKNLILPRQMVDNMRVVCPNVDLKMCEESVEYPEMVHCASPSFRVFSVSIVEPSLVLAKESHCERKNFVLDQKIKTSLALHVKDMFVSVSIPTCFSAGLTVHIHGVEMWKTAQELKDLKSILSASVASVQVKVAPKLIGQILDFVESLKSGFGKTKENFHLASQASEKWRTQVIYELTKYGFENGLSHDPKVITNPANILRSSKDHVRVYDSWRVITKLRSMSQQDFPAKNLQKSGFSAPKDAFSYIVKVFSRWRTWEGNLTQREQYFQEMIGKKDEKPVFNVLSVDLKTLEVGFLSETLQADYIAVENCSVQIQKVPSLDLVINVEDVDFGLSPKLLETIQSLRGVKGGEEGTLEKVKGGVKGGEKGEKESSQEKGSSERGVDVSLILGVKHFHGRLQLPKTVVEIHSFKSTISCGVSSSSKIMVATETKECGFSFGKEDVQNVNTMTRGFFLVFAGTKDTTKKKEQKGLSVGNLAGALDIGLQEVDIKVLDLSGSLTSAIGDLMDDIQGLKSVAEKEREKEPSFPDFSHLLLPTLSVAVDAGRVSLYMELMEPVRFFTSLTKSSFYMQSTGEETMLAYSYAKFTSDLVILETSILRTESSRFRVNTRTSIVNGFLLVNSVVHSGYFKATTPSVLSAMDMLLTKEKVIRERVRNLQELAKGKETGIEKQVGEKQVGEKHVGPEKEGKKMESNSLLNYIIFKGSVSQEYCGWSTYKDHSRYSIETEGIDVMVSNMDVSGQKSAVFGHFNVPATRVSIVDQSFSTRLSTVVDFNLCTKVSNEREEKEEEEEGVKRSLQIESEYFRACFSPSIVFKLYDFVDSFQTLTAKHQDRLDRSDKKDIKKSNKKDRKELDKLDRIESDSDSDIQTSKVKSESDKKDKSSQSGSSLGFHSVHVLLHNFCVGWLFDTAYKDYPGFILGAERIFAVTKANLGKLTVMDGYLSVANGSTASSFYSQLSESHSLNRAFMPKMQLSYYISPEGELWASLLGDILDVRFMSNSTIAIERAIHSVSQVMAHFEKRTQEFRKRPSHRRRKEDDRGERNDWMEETKRGDRNDWMEGTRREERKEEDGGEKQAGKTVFTPSFSAVQFSIMFAGSKVYIYQLQEENSGQPPSLTLHAPAVQIVIGYEYTKNQAKKHSIKTEILVTQSDNTVYSSCVPVLRDFVEASKTMVESESHDVKTKGSPKSDLSVIFQEIDFSLGLRVEKQRICLSCEPTAKVAAVVEFDGASVQASSGIEAFESVYILAKLSCISVSLQHIYSDERSGSFGIDTVILSSTVAFMPHVEIMTSCGISDIVGSVKMKQYQDVDLFTDIWSLKVGDKKRDKRKEVKKDDKAKGKEMKKEETSFSAALELVLSKTSIEVDFGASLGIMALDIDTAWAISRRTSNWFYEITLGLQKLQVKSEGRLGGSLVLDGLHLKSAVDWKLEEVLKIPLIHMSGGLGDFSFKLVFDEHVFSFCRMKQWNFDVYNRKNGINVSKDHLFVMIQYETIEVFLTSLAASEFYDIYNTISRMVEEKRTSYKEILKDSNKDADTDITNPLDVVKKLETKIKVATGITLVQVYPYSFNDNNVLVVEMDKSRVQFTQNEYAEGIFNQIELQLNNVRASFSATSGITVGEVADAEVHELIRYAETAKGGQILGLPKFMISMRTYQKYNTNRVEHLFQSSFGGTVDIRWNLGSVNTVREMYAAHKRALIARIETGKSDRGGNGDGDKEGNKKDEDGDKKDGDGNGPDIRGESEITHKDIDRDIQDTMEKVKKSKFVYSALVPPIIEAPQLKELGTATPPLEWFGLHRNKFPDATHQLVIVTLQKLLSEIEHEYSKTLGRA